MNTKQVNVLISKTSLSSSFEGSSEVESLIKAEHCCYAISNELLIYCSRFCDNINETKFIKLGQVYIYINNIDTYSSRTLGKCVGRFCFKSENALLDGLL